MSSQTPPYPYFNGIVYNASFFTPSSSSGTSTGLNYPTAQGAEYFPYGLTSVGITNAGTLSTGVLSSGLISSSNNIQAVGNITSSTGSIGNTAGTGLIGPTGAITGTSLNLGTGSIISGAIVASGNITGSSIGNTAGSGSIGSTGAITGTSLSLGTGTITSGAITGTGITGTSLNVGTGTIISGSINSSGSITGTGITGTSLSLGTGAISTVGNITSTGDIQATTGKIKTGTLDAVSDGATGTTALTIGSNVVLGNIVIGNSQTTGDIIIGASDISGATITVGTSLTSTTINGPITTTGIFTASQGLTVGSSQYITTSHAGTITVPTALQVGYIQSVSYSLPTVPTTTNLLTMSSITLSQGVWLLKGAVSITSSTSISYGFVSFGDTSRPTSIAPVVNDSLYGSVSFNGVPTASNEKVIPNLISFVSPTVSTTYYFNICLVGSGSGYNSQNWRLQGIRIA